MLLGVVGCCWLGVVDLSVGVVVSVVLADADEFGEVGRRHRLLHLRRQEVAEALAGEPVDVVDRVALPRQTVDTDPRSRRHVHLKFAIAQLAMSVRHKSGGNWDTNWCWTALKLLYNCSGLLELYISMFRNAFQLN